MTPQPRQPNGPRWNPLWILVWMWSAGAGLALALHGWGQLACAAVVITVLVYEIRKEEQGR